MAKQQPKAKPASAAAKKAPANKVFDVMRPGKSQPNTTSRPIIVKHKPKADPFLAQPNQQAETKRSLLDGRGKITIKPADDAEIKAAKPTEPTEKTVEKPAQKLAEPKQLAAVAVQVSVPAEKSTPEKTNLPSHPDPDDVDDTQSVADLASVAVHSEVQAAPDVDPDYQPPAAQANPQPKPEPVAAKSAVAPAAKQPAAKNPSPSSMYTDIPENLMPDAAIDDLYSNQPSPQVFVSHHNGSSWLKVVLWLLVILLLLAGVVDVLLDSGFLPITGIPHTHYFN